ncbi:MAG: hemin uptake protein HemP [Ramlibacter sp.]|nr:hemin uptake protein HemP [Ramlibacter sp.]
MRDSTDLLHAIAAPPGLQGAAVPLPQGHAVVDGARQVASAELLQGSRCVEICHNGAIYRLQATKLGKLILTK